MAQNADLTATCRSEFEAALNADRVLAAAKKAAPSPPDQVSYFSIALASSIPFIGMGAIDNSIMASCSSHHDGDKTLMYRSFLHFLVGQAKVSIFWSLAETCTC